MTDRIATNIPSNDFFPTKRTLRLLFYFVSFAVIGCGGMLICFYLTLNGQYIRGNFVAPQAQQHIEGIYEQVRAISPTGTSFAWDEKPHSGTYAWSLSDSAEQIAYAHAQQAYHITIPFDGVLANYNQTFSGWGWSKVPTGDMAGSVFKYPHYDHLLVDVCIRTGPGVLPGDTQYAFFFDFDEGNRCAEYCPDRLCCVVRRCCHVR